MWLKPHLVYMVVCELSTDEDCDAVEISLKLIPLPYTCVVLLSLF